MNKYPPLHIAAQYGWEKTARMLLEHGVNVNLKNTNGESAMHLAAESGKIEITRMLIDYGGDVNLKDNNGQTPLSYALEKCNLPMINLLLTSGVKVEGIAQPLHAAIKKRSVEIVEELLKHNADINKQDDRGRTPLILAVLKENDEIAKLLINKGADINIKQNNSTTVLHNAAFKGNESIVRLLLQHDANVNCRDEMGAPPLYYTALRGHVEIVNVFLDNGFDINCRDESGRTALHVACRAGCTEVAELLLVYDSDINATDNQGRTPLNVSIGGLTPYQTLDDDRDSYWFEDIVELFIKHITRMKAANKHINENNSLTLSQLFTAKRHPERKKLEFKCQEEIEKLKIEKISDKVSYSDILIRGVHKVALYARNENVIQVMESGDYEQKFPIYSNTLRRIFIRGKGRRDLLCLCASMLNYLFIFKLPNLVTEKILEYLSETDLINLAKTCRIYKKTYLVKK